ncbi:MAG TPA: hypothetical protein VGL82_04095 [Bryobacteraceae bacterium]
MADLWLEEELKRQLAPVVAPGSLWDRIEHPRPAPRHGIAPAKLWWPLVAVTVLLTVIITLHNLDVPHNQDTLVEREVATLTGISKGFDFRSENFQDIRKWAKVTANIDIDRPPGAPSEGRSTAQLLGVRLIQLQGLPVAAIAYRMGDETATLFISGKRAGLSGNTGASKHLFFPKTTTGNTRFVSWNMRNETYTIAFPGTKSFQAACLLCHATTPI